MRTWRVTRPSGVTRATPSTLVRRFCTVWSAISDSSRSLRPLAISASVTVGCELSLSKRLTNGGLTSRLKPDCTTDTLSRTSCVARVMSTDRLNSTTVSLRPS